MAIAVHHVRPAPTYEQVVNDPAVEKKVKKKKKKSGKVAPFPTADRYHCATCGLRYRLIYSTDCCDKKICLFCVKTRAEGISQKSACGPEICSYCCATGTTLVMLPPIPLDGDMKMVKRNSCSVQ